jgi:hypothetical protein
MKMVVSPVTLSLAGILARCAEDQNPYVLGRP